MTTSNPLIIAFAWGPIRYARAAARLKHRCDELGLDHDVRIFEPNDPCMEHHFAHKPYPEWPDSHWCFRFIPKFILHSMVGHQRDVLYVHADHTIRHAPPAGAFDGLDIGVQRRWKYKPESRLKCLAAPIFVRHNDNAMRFIRTWETMCMNIHNGGGEHELLWLAVRLFSRDRSCRVDWFRTVVASQCRDADCAIVGHR